MKIIHISQGKTALVDDEDYEYLSQFKWYAVKTRTINFYAVRHGNGKNIYMHREILGQTRLRLTNEISFHPRPSAYSIFSYLRVSNLILTSLFYASG